MIVKLVILLEEQVIAQDLEMEVVFVILVFMESIAHFRVNLVNFLMMK